MRHTTMMEIGAFIVVETRKREENIDIQNHLSGQLLRFMVHWAAPQSTHTNTRRKRRRVGDAHLVAEMKGWVVADGSSIACGCCVVMVSSYAAALKGEEDKNGKRCRYEDF